MIRKLIDLHEPHVKILTRHGIAVGSDPKNLIQGYIALMCKDLGKKYPALLLHFKDVIQVKPVKKTAASKTSRKARAEKARPTDKPPVKAGSKKVKAGKTSKKPIVPPVGAVMTS
jgi:hypothetical protein